MPEPQAEPELPATAGPIKAGRTKSKLRRRVMVGLQLLAFLVGFWLLAAYFILPALWEHYEHHPALEDAPKTTRTAQGIPGDPLNVGLVGSESDVVHAMLRAGWNPADPIAFESSVKIAASVVFRRPDPDAPVSSLYLFDRRQDLAFEKPVGHDARRRHHVRFWKSQDLGDLRPPLFIGSATFDVRVGFSHDTGQITHHISPDVDAERDGLIADLVGAGPSRRSTR